MRKGCLKSPQRQNEQKYVTRKRSIFQVEFYLYLKKEKGKVCNIPMSKGWQIQRDESINEPLCIESLRIHITLSYLQRSTTSFNFSGNIIFFVQIINSIFFPEQQKKLYTMWQTRGSTPNIPMAPEILELFIQNARTIHFCITPLLFLPRYGLKFHRLILVHLVKFCLDFQTDFIYVICSMYYV